MKRVLAWGVPGLMALIACSTPTAQPGGTGPDSGPDAGPADLAGGERSPDAVDDGPPEVAPPPTPTGRRAYIMTATVASTKITGNTADTPSVNAHEFTMVVDWDTGTAILGSADGGGRVGFETAPGGIVIRQSVRFVSGVGRRTTLTYASFELAVSAGVEDVFGIARGQATCAPLSTDVGVCSADFTMSLKGVPDTVPPVLSSDDNGTRIDPFHSMTLTASEPLPEDTRLTLVDLFDAPIVVAPTDLNAAVFTFFPSAGKLWRFDDRYTLMAESLVDFAGNRASAVFTFTTGSPPPLVAEDGFESATGTTVAGAQVLSGAGAPVISGTRSLYIPSLQAQPGSGWNEATQLALRLALEPGDKVLRFAYRTVNADLSPSQPFYLMASEGGQIVYQMLFATTATTTIATFPGGGQASLGPIMTAEFALPPDAVREIVFTRNLRACCGGGTHPVMTAAGIIIDDLRAE
jgi:hypothetical protein